LRRVNFINLLNLLFSMASFKRLTLNRHLLERFISLLDLDSTLIKSHPNFPVLCSYGAIAYYSYSQVG
jgi:hypothetical protein